MKEKSFWFWFGIILAISLVVVPALLNWILQWHVPVCIGIIGEEDAPRVWLAFWGAFLAAIGSLVMAIITFFTAREDRRQDFKKHEIDHLWADYSIIEKEIQENEMVHSRTYFYTLLHGASETIKDEEKRINYALDVWFIKLTRSSTSAIKYNTYNYSGKYIDALGRVNRQCFDLIDNAKEVLKEKGKEINIYEVIPMEFESDKWSYGDMFNEGFEFLKNFHSKIQEKHDELKSKSL